MLTLGDPYVLRVALIDDDSGLLNGLERCFATRRWEAHVLGYAARPDQLASLRLHALVVNPALSGLDYVELVAAALPGLALLVCSAPASLADRVRGLRGGADDWLTKPCHPEELVARIDAVIRRRRAGELPLEQSTLATGELSIRPDRFDAFVRERAAGLSPKEFELLHQLAKADGRVLEREDVYQRVWGYTMVRGDRSVDVFVRKLRKKLELISPGWRYVHTHFGVGYRFAVEPTTSPVSTTSTSPAPSPSASASSSPVPAAVDGVAPVLWRIEDVVDRLAAAYPVHR